MEVKLKQRLVGLIVLAALATVFLPSLFHRDQRVAVDTTTLIPPKPSVAPIVITRPVKPEGVTPAPLPEEAFQPSAVPANIASPGDKSSKPAKATLNKQGLPNGWVVQLGSFQSQKRAEELTRQLLANRYKAYSRATKTAKGTFYRVFVGPYIDKSGASSVKKRLDKVHKVDSRVLLFTAE